MLLLLLVGFGGFWAYRTKRLQLHFRSLSQVDGLTGIANRPHFLARAQDELDSAQKARRPLCILLCDLDHFKAINDRYGHATGDQVLRQAVNECQAYLRADDLFGRVGGEEFAILLTDCALEDARSRAEQLRQTIAGICVNSASGFRTSGSFGIASTGTSGFDLRQLLAHADSALYAAKRAGRNRVAVYEASVATIGAGLPLPEEADTHMAGNPDIAAAKILGIAGS